MTDSSAATTNRADLPEVVEASLDELVERARRLTTAGRRPVLGLPVRRGPAKSTLCEALLDARGQDAVLVGMDGFHLANSELARLGRADRKGAPDTFDVDGYVALLNRLRRPGDAPIYAPVFDRGIEESIGSAVSVPADVPLVIKGTCSSTITWGAAGIAWTRPGSSPSIPLCGSLGWFCAVSCSATRWHRPAAGSPR